MAACRPCRSIGQTFSCAGYPQLAPAHLFRKVPDTLSNLQLERFTQDGVERLPGALDGIKWGHSVGCHPGEPERQCAEDRPAQPLEGNIPKIVTTLLIYLTSFPQKKTVPRSHLWSPPHGCAWAGQQKVDQLLSTLTIHQSEAASA